MKLVIISMFFALNFITSAFSQEVDFLYADSISSMAGDTFNINFYYSDPYYEARFGLWQTIYQPYFCVINYSLEDGILESLFCDISFSGGYIFGFAVQCSIPPAFRERIVSLTAVTPTNLSPNRYNDEIYSRIVDQYGWMLEDTAMVRLNIQNPTFSRGDVSHNGVLDSMDLAILANYIFQGQSLSSPIGIGDIDLDGRIDVEDILLLRNQIYELRR